MSEIVYNTRGRLSLIDKFNGRFGFIIKCKTYRIDGGVAAVGSMGLMAAEWLLS